MFEKQQVTRPTDTFPTGACSYSSNEDERGWVVSVTGFSPLFSALVLLKRGSLFERFDDSLPRRFPNGKVLYAVSRTCLLIFLWLHWACLRRIIKQRCCQPSGNFVSFREVFFGFDLFQRRYTKGPRKKRGNVNFNEFSEFNIISRAPVSALYHWLFRINSNKNFPSFTIIIRNLRVQRTFHFLRFNVLYIT